MVFQEQNINRLTADKNEHLSKKILVILDEVEGDIVSWPDPQEDGSSGGVTITESSASTLAEYKGLSLSFELVAFLWPISNLTLKIFVMSM